MSAGENIEQNSLTPLGLGIEDLANETGIDLDELKSVVHGQSDMKETCPEEMSTDFGNSADFWLEL